MKVKSVRKIGFSDFRRIFNEKDFYETRQAIFDKHEVDIGDYDEIPVDQDQLRIFVGNPMKVIIETDEGNLEYLFKPGFMTDYGSVPKRARGFLDNDSIFMIIPSIVHDINFREMFLSFNLTNDLFKQMLRFEGASWWQASKAYYAVQWFGEKNYAVEKPEYDTQVEFNW